MILSYRLQLKMEQFEHNSQLLICHSNQRIYNILLFKLTGWTAAVAAVSEISNLASK